MISLLSRQRVLANQFKFVRPFAPSFFCIGNRKRDLRKPYEMKSPTPSKPVQPEASQIAAKGDYSTGLATHKKTIHTFKPNIHRKRIYSQTLDMKVRMYVSTKALKTILKKGGLDQYLLNTKPKQIDSKFGMYLKEAIVHKQEKPDEPTLYIPYQKKVKKSRYKPQRSSFGGRPAIYQAPQFRVRPQFLQTARSHTELRIREREELYKKFREADITPATEQTVELEGKVDAFRTEDGRLYQDVLQENSETMPQAKKEEFDYSKVSKDILEEIEILRPQLLQMLPFRHAAIREELLKYKNKRGKLLTLLHTIEESEVFIERVLEDQYVGFFERYPDLAQIFMDIAERDKVALGKLTQGFGKKEAILGPDGVKLEQQLIEADTEGRGTELSTNLDYNPKQLLKRKKKKDRLKDIKKKFDHK